MADLGVLELAFRTKLAELDKELATARKKAGQAADDMGDEMERRIGPKMSKVGLTITKSVTPAALALGAAFAKADEAWGDGSDSIISKTGATGKALESLEDSMTNVGKGVRTGLGDIGGVVGDLNTALGVTGKPLEELTSKVVKLQELGESFDAMSFTRFMGDWTIATEDGGAALDKLYKTAQVTGISVGELMEKATQFGAPMRALGFDVDTTTALLGKWTKEGVNVETVLASMKSALGKFAKAGEDPKTSLQNLIATMKGFGTDAEAMALAAELVGVKTGPDLAMAIREGRFDIDAMSASLSGATGSIDSAYQATIGWTDKLVMLKNHAFGVIGPVGEMGMGIAGIAAGIGPMIAGVGMAVGPMMGFAAAAWAAVAPLLPWILAIGALIAIGVLLVKNWDTIKAAAGAVWDWIWDKVGSVVSAIGGFLGGLISTTAGFVADWAWLLLGPIGAMWHFRDEIWGAVQAVIGFLGRLVSAAGEKGAELISWAAGVPGAILNALGDMGSLLWNTGVDIVRGLINGIASMGSTLWNAVTGFISRNIPGPVKRVLGIGSPSKVAMDLMLDVGAGMVQGLDASERMVARAASTLAGAVEPDLLQLAVAGHDQSMASLAGMGSYGRDQSGAGGIDYDRLAAAIAKATATRGMVNNFAQGTDPMHVAREIAWRTGY